MRPLPVCAAPAGQPLSRWLDRADARANPILGLLRDLVVLVDQLAGKGYLPSPFGPEDVWLSDTGLSWLPGILVWQRPGRLPTGVAVRAAGRTVVVLLRDLLRQIRELPGISLVWEELWALCHDLLEHGYGVNAAGVAARLEQLRLRSCGERDGAAPAQTAVLVDAVPAHTAVLVDAASVQRVIGYRTLDLTGYLRQLLGSERITEGCVLGRADTPEHWQSLGRSAGFAWLEAEQTEMREFGEQWRGLGIAELHVLAGRFEDVADYLPLLRPPRGTLTLLTASPPSLYLPERWAPGLSAPSLNAWCRMGWPGAKVVEVPGHETD